MFFIIRKDELAKSRVKLTGHSIISSEEILIVIIKKQKLIKQNMVFNNLRIQLTLIVEELVCKLRIMISSPLGQIDMTLTTRNDSVGFALAIGPVNAPPIICVNYSISVRFVGMLENDKTENFIKGSK